MKALDEKLKYLLYLLLIVGIGILLYLHFRLSITRYFDADEFAHLHWGYAFLTGEKPYTDFFYLFPPFFLYPIAIIIKLFGRTFESLIAARIFIFIIYLGTLSMLFLITKKARGVLAALFAVFIFVFLPMPQDKTIEIRPDLVAVFFALLGIYLFILAENNKEQTTNNRKNKKLLLVTCYLLSGLSYGLSLAFVPKTVFFLIPIGIIWGYRIINQARGNTEANLIKNILTFGMGILLPALCVLGFIFWSGKPQLAIYSMTKMASTVTSILGSKFYMFASHFFWPTDVYYGSGGFNPALCTTLAIFLVGTIVGVFRGVASLSYKEKSKCVSEFLIFGSFYAMLFAFVKIFPLKHAQYWIPMVPFFCFYIGDFFVKIPRVLSLIIPPIGTPLRSALRVRAVGVASFAPPVGFFIVILLICYLTYLGASVYQSKFKWTDKDTQDKMDYFLTKIPENEPVFDLTGETVFFRDGYYFCCVPYGQYEEGIGFDIPDIKSEMEKNGTKYVHVGYAGRTRVLPPDQEKYIKENFESFDTNPFLWRKKITL